MTCCCNCQHDIRTNTKDGIKNHCDIDGHYIGYVECFEGWCERWGKETDDSFKASISLVERIEK